MSVYDEYELLQQRQSNNPYYYDKQISLNEYIKTIATFLKEDVLMACNYLQLEAKPLFLKLVKIAYTKRMKKPRLRIDWSIRQFQLYEQKRYHSIVVYQEYF